MGRAAQNYPPGIVNFRLNSAEKHRHARRNVL
nr:MAG TPA: hypothetical protein [Caudoviricetes sp.]